MGLRVVARSSERNMAYLGNRKGPRESVVIETLGPTYFGSDWGRLQEDIEWHRFHEQREDVKPVHVDDDGRPFIELSGADGLPRHLVLEEHGWVLDGEIDTFTDDERARWHSRVLG